MFTKLILERFKNFRHAELALGPVTTLIGTNASGKSNLRDAFRFLHGIGRGYSFAEIIGEKYGEGGERVWSGIRGGLREIAYLQAESFSLTLHFLVPFDPERPKENLVKHTYTIEVNPGLRNGSPKRVGESLYITGDDFNIIYFDSFLSSGNDAEMQSGYPLLQAIGAKLNAQQPILTQIVEQLLKYLKSEEYSKSMEEYVKREVGLDPNSYKKFNLAKDRSLWVIAEEIVSIMESMRFFDFDPQALRRPSFPGQPLGDHGENFSSALQSICEDQQQKHTLIEWIRELTPMDVRDVEFTPDQTGKILLTLVEENGRQISAYSASDGTLRFLAVLAALLGPKSAKLLFFEEIENGLHPSRLHLLLQLMERQATQGKMQIINTTHSPQFLRFLSPATREYASLTYRLPDSPEGRIKRLLDIPEAQRLIQEHDIANLHESGWFEDALFLDETEGAE